MTHFSFFSAKSSKSLLKTPPVLCLLLSLVALLSGCGASMRASGDVATPTITMSATPNTVMAGGTSALTVAAANATQVVVTGSDGSSFNLQPAGGTQTITPAATTTYTAIATGAGGKASAVAVVTMVSTTAPSATPTVSIAAAPAAISAGGTSTLSITALNATQVMVTGNDGSSFTLQATGGVQAVTPFVTTTYTAVATGPGGSSSATTTVAVTPATPTVRISASPLTIATPGGSTTLTVSAANATQVTISGSDGKSYTLQAAGGLQLVSPAATTTYTATATGAGGTTSSSVIVTVTPTAPTVKVTASINPVPSGTSTVIGVIAANAASVTLTDTNGISYPLALGGGTTPTGGTATVTPTTSTKYTAVATAADGTAISGSVTVVVVPPNAPTVSIVANPASISSGNNSTLTIAAVNATEVTMSGSDNTTFTLQSTGGTQVVTPQATTTYTVSVKGPGGSTSASTVVTVTPLGSLQSVGHVVLMLQENHTFDNYFGMLNPYRKANNWNIGDDGNTYNVDGIDDKLTTISNPNDGDTLSFSPFKFTSTCIDDLSSAWLESYGDVSRYDFSPGRKILLDGFVHTASSFAANCQNGGTCSGTFSDFAGQRAMGYYDQDFLNYYYYMASQFAVSDRWFSPLSSKSIPNRIATFTGGSTQGLAHDPGNDDHLPQLAIPSIFQELDQNKVSWKIYYTVTQGACLSADDCTGGASEQYPAINFTYLAYSYQYLYENPTGTACVAPTQSSTVVGDTSGSFCIDPDHIAPLSTYYTDLTNSTLPSFAFIEAGYGHNDEHPGSGQSILSGQQQVSSVINAFMASPEWKESVFFLAYDEGGGPYDHVPPVAGHSNDNTAPVVGSTALAAIPDISTIAVNADSYIPCVSGGAPTLHCDLAAQDPGAKAGDAPVTQGFAAQLGFRVPNLVISPFTRRHFVSHIPMDHTAITKFVETRFVPSSANLTPHEAAQPNLLDFFDFTNTPWATPPTPPTPASPATLNYDPCTPTKFGP